MKKKKELTKELTRDFFVNHGRRGGKATAKHLTPEERAASARKAARARWAKKKDAKS